MSSFVTDEMFGKNAIMNILFYKSYMYFCADTCITAHGVTYSYNFHRDYHNTYCFGSIGDIKSEQKKCRLKKMSS